MKNKTISILSSIIEVVKKGKQNTFALTMLLVCCFVTIPSSSNASPQDDFYQQVKSIIQELVESGAIADTTYNYTSKELKNLLIKVNDLEREDKHFWDIEFWTGQKDFYLNNMKLMEIYDVTDEFGFANVLCQGENLDGEPKDVIVTWKLIFEDGNWLICDRYNLRAMLNEFLVSGIKIPAVEGKLRFIHDKKTAEQSNEKPADMPNEQPFVQPADTIIKTLNEAGELCSIAIKNSDKKEKIALLSKALNIYRNVMSNPDTSLYILDTGVIKEGIAYIEEQLKKLGVNP